MERRKTLGRSTPSPFFVVYGESRSKEVARPDSETVAVVVMATTNMV